VNLYYIYYFFMSKLFVRINGLDRNMPPAERVELIKKIFVSVYPEITDESVQLIADKEYGGYRNFCFVTCESDQVGPISEALDGQEVEGYQLTVNEAEPPREKKPFDRNSPRPSYGGGASRGGSTGGSRGGYSNDRSSGNGGGSRGGNGGYSSNRY
jgi:uncharacterized membrane protein YgcG